MTHRGPFQPVTFCDSVILVSLQLHFTTSTIIQDLVFHLFP